VNTVSACSSRQDEAVDYDRAREAEAKRLASRGGTLDKKVASERDYAGGEEGETTASTSRSAPSLHAGGLICGI
jgi:hypothetical protein